PPTQIPIAEPAAPSAHFTRGFVLWRLSDDGRAESRTISIGRHPKPSTEAVIRSHRPHSAESLFGQPPFPKTLNKQLRVFGTPGDMRRYGKGGIDLKHSRRRGVRLSVASEMGEGRTRGRGKLA